MTNLYSVSYNTNNSTGGTTPPTQTAESNSPTYSFIAPKQNDLVREGYIFMGWAENPSTVYPEYMPSSTITLTKVNSNKTLYAVWVNGNSVSPVNTWNELYYMQQMSPTACASIATPTSTTEAPQKQLYDVRDGKQYWVAKLKDGNCWMTQNLDLDLQQGVALTDADSDFAESAIKSWAPGENEGTILEALSTVNWPNTNNIVRSWDPALGGNPTYCNDGNKTAGSCKTSGNPITSVNDGHDAQGNYYSWGAATAGEASSLTSDTAGQESTRSICPKGWRLPSDNNSTSSAKGPTYTGLQTAYNIGSTGSKFLNSPLYFVYGGFVNGGKLDYAGRYGFYWSSTANGGTNAYSLRFDSSTVYPSYPYNRCIGMPVRCVAK